MANCFEDRPLHYAIVASIRSLFKSYRAERSQSRPRKEHYSPDLIVLGDFPVLQKSHQDLLRLENAQGTPSIGSRNGTRQLLLPRFAFASSSRTCQRHLSSARQGWVRALPNA